MQKSKVLLIEDEKIDALGVGRVRKELYPSVLLEVISTGEQALDWIHRYRKNDETMVLVLMDMSVPRMDGLTLISEIKAIKDLAFTPVVVLSGNDSSGAIQNNYESGACAYIVKRQELKEMKRILSNTFTFWLENNALHRMGS